MRQTPGLGFERKGMMKKTAFVFSAFLVAAGACGISAAGEEYMPLVPGPGAYSRVSSADAGDGGAQRPTLRKNIIRLSVPSPENRPDSRIRMMEASPEEPGGALRFRPAEAGTESRRVGIPGLVPPELLAVSRMEEEMGRGTRAPRISLPSALGTEELMEFDPYSVQRTGDPFRDTPGEAEAFPAAATHSQVWGEAWNNGVFPFENNSLRPPNAARAQNANPAPDVADAEGTADIVAPKIHSLRPPGSSVTSAISATDAVASTGAGSLRPGASAAISAMQPPAVVISLPPLLSPPVASARSVITVSAPPPPLPELEVRSHVGGPGQTRRTVGGVAMPPPLSARDMALSAPLLMAAPQTPERPPVQRGEFSLLMPSSREELSAGLKLALPPETLTEGNGGYFSYGLPEAPEAPMRIASSAGHSPAGRYEDFEAFEVYEPAPERRPALRESISVPPLTVEEFTPMRGVKIY